MKKVGARHVTSGAVTQRDVFIADLWSKNVWAGKATVHDSCISQTDLLEAGVQITLCMSAMKSIVVCLSASSSKCISLSQTHSSSFIKQSNDQSNFIIRHKNVLMFILKSLTYKLYGQKKTPVQSFSFFSLHFISWIKTNICGFSISLTLFLFFFFLMNTSSHLDVACHIVLGCPGLRRKSSRQSWVAAKQFAHCSLSCVPP